MFAMSSISLSLFVMVYFCASRHDVQECFRRIPIMLRSLWEAKNGVKDSDTIDGHMAHPSMGGVGINSNLPITPSQNLFQEPQHGITEANYLQDGKGGQLMVSNEFPSETNPFLQQHNNMDTQYTLPPPPHLSQLNPALDGQGLDAFVYGGSENTVGIRTTGYPTGGSVIPTSIKTGSISRTASNVASTASRARIKVNSMFGGGNKHGNLQNYKDSDHSSDHLSVNNMNHLRRGYVAPVNSEAEYSLAGGSTAPSMPPPPPPINGNFRSLHHNANPQQNDSFGSSTNPARRGEQQVRTRYTNDHPKTSSPTAGHSFPFTDQDLTVSPLVNENRLDVQDPSYDFMPPMSNNGQPAVGCLLYTSPSPRDGLLSRMPSSA